MSEMIKHPPKRVAIYMRVSTEDQIDRHGPETQREAIMNLIKAKQDVPEPLVFAGPEHVYFDEGISGTVPVDDRPQFTRLKEALIFSNQDTRPFDAVAVYRIDRFARKLKVLLSVIDFFEDHKIELISVTENIDTSSPFGKAILSIIGVIAELEIETIKQRTQAGRELASRSGVYMGNAPVFGYVKNKEKRIEILKEEAQYVRLIFSLFVEQKYTIGGIQSYLKEYKVPSPEISATQNRKRKGEPKKRSSAFHWHYEQVRLILKNELYTGRSYYHKQEGGKKLPKEKWRLSPFEHPAIIDMLTFGKAQRLLEQSKHTKKETKRRDHAYLLAGLLKCDHCRALRASAGSYQHWIGSPKQIKSSGEYTYYYSCGRKSWSKYEEACKVLPLPAGEIEKYVVDYCLQLLKSPVAVFQCQQKLKSQKLSSDFIQKKSSSLKGLLDGVPARKDHLLEQHEHGMINRDDLEEKLKKLKESEIRYREELRVMEERWAQNSLSDEYIVSLELFNEKYRDVLTDVRNKPEEAYKVLHMLIEEIIVYSRPATNDDVIAGRRSEGQQIPNRLHIKLKLPQDILNELAEVMNPEIEKTPPEGGAGSRQIHDAGGRGET